MSYNIKKHNRSEETKLKYFYEFQIEIISTSVTRKEAIYPCCMDETYPSLALNIVFKQKSSFYHGRLHTSEGHKASPKKPDSSEEHN
jgi:hypothetical protein